MPKTTITTFIALIHKLNDEIDHFSTVAADTLHKINALDETSITQPSQEEELSITYLDCQTKFDKIIDMRNVLMDGLLRKVMQNMSARSASQLSTKSATLRRSAKRRSRRTRRTRSI